MNALSQLTPMNPLSGAPGESTEVTSLESLSRLVSQARDAQVSWSQCSLKERSHKVKSLARLITERRVEGVAIITEETGRPESVAALSEVNNVLAFAGAAIKEASIALKKHKVGLSPLDFPGKSAVVEQVPRGVVGIIAPWNYPVSNFYKSLFPALLAGNSVILKPSELTPRTGAWLSGLAEEVLGAGIVTCVQGDGVVGAELIKSGIDSVVFTGSVATGKRVAETAASQLIPCSLELGGKDAALVLEDANLERTALGIAQWSLFNTGQDCSSIERLFVVDTIADQLLERLAQIYQALRVAGDERIVDGEEADLGPLQSSTQLDIVSSQVSEAVEAGAHLICGGSPTGVGYGFQPTILDRCTAEMRVAHEESFGPILAVTRVANAEEAIKLMNSSIYGLNGSVWTRDLKRGEALARQLEVGVALVNNHSFTGSLPQTPWTGVKDTGYGVASSRWSYHTFARPRTVVIDKNTKPDPFWLPVDESYRAFVEAVAQKNLGGGLRVMWTLIRLLGKRVKVICSLGRT
jgi:acyl-CoA reductase-like NAD-dependent aldehyde dehydrogenase